MDLIYMQMKGNKRRIHTGNPGLFEKGKELDLAQVTHPHTHIDTHIRKPAVI